MLNSHAKTDACRKNFIRMSKIYTRKVKFIFFFTLLLITSLEVIQTLKKDVQFIL
jgi:hypothetical protein